MNWTYKNLLAMIHLDSESSRHFIHLSISAIYPSLSICFAIIGSALFPPAPTPAAPNPIPLNPVEVEPPKPDPPAENDDEEAEADADGSVYNPIKSVTALICATLIIFGIFGSPLRICVSMMRTALWAALMHMESAGKGKDLGGLVGVGEGDVEVWLEEVEVELRVDEVGL